MTTMTRYSVHAIEPTRLAAVRAAREDGHGNEFLPYPAEGGEPLRCCLRRAHADERIALISYAPFVTASPWREVGPVFVHAVDCGGYRPTTADGLPAQLRRGPRLLRTYRADETMNYEHNTIVADGEDIAPTLERLLGEPDIAIVHVRTLLPQCFLYAVTA